MAAEERKETIPMGDTDEAVRMLNRSLHDWIVTVQAAWIEAQQNGAAAAMTWIENALDGPDIFPDDLPEGWDANDYYARHRTGGTPCMATGCDFWSTHTFGGQPPIYLCRHHGDWKTLAVLAEEIRRTLPGGSAALLEGDK